MSESNNATLKNLYKLDGRIPVKAAIPYGLQHILAMLVSNITPVIIVAAICGVDTSDIARIIQSTMVIAGVGTLIQLFPFWKIGSGLPIVVGCSFTFVSIMCYLGPVYGYSTILGAVLVGGLVQGVLGLLSKYWIKFITPLVAASVVMAIGLSLFPVGANSFGGGTGAADFGSAQNWIVGTVTLVVCLIFFAFGKGFFRSLSILLGLIAGYIVALCFGMVDFSAVLEGGVVSPPAFLNFGYKFNISAIISVICIFLVSSTETIGDTSALASSAFGREATQKEIGGALACDGFVSALSSVFCCLPITSYSQNIGLVAMTRVVNRRAIASGAIIMIIAGFFPVIGNLLATLPQAVLGGCTIMMFGTIVVSGIQMIGKCGFSRRNITIVALSLAVGVGFTSVPDIFNIFPIIIRSIFAENCVAVVFVLAIVLNLILPKNKKTEKGEK